MGKTLAIFVIIALFITGFSTVNAGNPQNESAAQPDTLMVGMVPFHEAQVMIDSIDPLTELLSEELNMPVEGTVLTSYTSVIEAMGTGRVDVGIFGPFALVLGEQRHNLQVILTALRNGESHYEAQFVTRSDSEIENLNDVRDKTAAFVDPASASGFLFPYVHMLDAGIDPETDLDKYIYAGSHDAALLAVYNQEVDFKAGIDARGQVRDEVPDIDEKVEVFATSSAIPNDGVAVRPELDDQLVDSIQQAFITIGDTEEGQELLETLYLVTGFTTASRDKYDIVRRTYEKMEEYIEF